MSASVKIECDANGCCNQIENSGTSDDVQQLIEWNKWHEDPVTDEFHYCPGCWPEVKAEYEEVE